MGTLTYLDPVTGQWITTDDGGTGGGVELTPGIIETQYLADYAVTNVKLATGSVDDRVVSGISASKITGSIPISQISGTITPDYLDQDWVDELENKSKVLYSNDPPTGTFDVGDTWFDSNDGYKMHTWSGTAWVPVVFGSSALDPDIGTTIGNAFVGSIVEYSLGTETNPGSSWSTTSPTRTPGTYIWSRTTITRGDGSSSQTTPVLVTGNDGAPGQTTYTWLKYADSPTTGMSDSPDGKTHMGLAFNKTTPTESSNYGDYQWSLIKGEDGVAVDGTTFYTWVKYADNASGGGMSDSPAGKTYIGFAFNKETATESSTPGDYQWSLIKGADGASPPLVTLSASAQILVSPAGGGATTPATAVVTGVASNTTINSWTYSSDGGSFVTGLPAGVVRSGNVVTITGSSMTARTITVRMADANGVQDTLTIAKVDQGAIGADAYTVVLSNEAMTFPGSTTAALAGSNSTTITALKGAASALVTVGTISTPPAGMSTSITGNGTSAPVITVNVTTALVSTSGELTVPLTVDGIAFQKKISWSVSRAGAPGSKGDKGDAGRGILSVTPYFLKQTSSVAPGKPTTNPPGGSWTTTEPAYENNTYLFRTELITYNNSTFEYTDVSRVASYAAAITAIASASGKNTNYYGTTEPSGGTYTSGDTWFDTSDGNKIHIFNGSTWVEMSDGRIDSLAAGQGNRAYYEASQPTAPTGGFMRGDMWFDTANNYALYVWSGTAWQKAQDAYAVQTSVMSSLDGKNKIVYSPTEPTGSGFVTGDTWFDTDDGGKIYTYDSTKTPKWQPQLIGSQALTSQLSASIVSAETNAQNALNSITDIMADNKVTPDEKQLLKREWDVIVAEKTILNNQATTYGVTTENTNYNTKYSALNTYVNTTYPLFTNLTTTTTIDSGNTLRLRFKEYYDARTALLNAINAKINSAASAAMTAAGNAQTTANSKNKVYYSTTKPTGGTYSLGDIWYDTDDGYKTYIHNGTDFVAAPFGTNAIADGAITTVKVSEIASTKITAAWLEAGNIKANSITGTMIAGTQITAAHMVTGTITAASGIIADAAITTAKIADLAVNDAKIANLDGGKITALSIDATKIKANTITADKLESEIIKVGTALIQNGAIGTAHIGLAQITEALIKDLAVTNAKIANLAVTNAKINDLDGNKIHAKSITADKVVIGNSENIVVDGQISSAATWSGTAWWSATGGRSGFGSITVPTGTALRGVFQTISTTNRNYLNPVTEEVKYHVSVWVRPSVAAPIDSISLQVRGYGATFASSSDYVSAEGSPIRNTVAIPAGEWHKISGYVTIPEDKSYAALGFYAESTMTGSVVFSDPSMRPSLDTALIVNGSIQADHIDVDGLKATFMTIGEIDPQYITNVPAASIQGEIPKTQLEPDVRATLDDVATKASAGELAALSGDVAETSAAVDSLTTAIGADTTQQMIKLDSSGILLSQYTFDGTSYSAKYQLALTGEKLSFIDSQKEVAWISGQRMYIPTVAVSDSLLVGAHDVELAGTGNDAMTVFRWVGAQ